MKVYLKFILMLALFALTACQTTTIRVVEADSTAQPISGAEIWLATPYSIPNPLGRTDSNGEFKINSGFLHDSFGGSIHKDGYHDAIIPMTKADPVDHDSSLTSAYTIINNVIVIRLFKNPRSEWLKLSPVPPIQLPALNPEINPLPESVRALRQDEPARQP